MHVPTPDPAMFTGPIGEITNALDPYTEGAKVGVHVSLLSAFSGYLGQTTRVQTNKGLSPLAFWTVLVGVTGKGRKGTATKISLKVVESAFTAWADANIIYGCPATGLGLITELADRSEDGICDPVFLVEEEMDDFIDNAKRDKRVGVYLRKGFDGADLAHKTAKDDIRVRKTHISFVGHVQPKNWAAISGSKDASGGTYNRFLPVAVERSKTLPVFGSLDPSDVIREQARKLRRIAAFAREVDVVTVPDEVAEVFESIHRPACEGLINGNEALAQMSERAMDYLVRLAALYALADSRDQISVADFDASLALVRYSVETVVAVLPEAGGDRLTSKIAAAVQAQGELTKSELWDVVGRNVKVRDIANALKALPQIQVFIGESEGGRPPVYYRWVEDEDIDLDDSEQDDENAEVFA